MRRQSDFNRYGNQFYSNGRKPNLPDQEGRRNTVDPSGIAGALSGVWGSEKKVGHLSSEGTIVGY